MTINIVLTVVIIGAIISINFEPLTIADTSSNIVYDDEEGEAAPDQDLTDEEDDGTEEDSMTRIDSSSNIIR